MAGSNRDRVAEQLRVFWRVERRRQLRYQIITAAIYRPPHDHELRVFLGPEETNDLLWLSVERFGREPLEAEAADLRDVLLEKGWSDLQQPKAT